MASQRNIGIFDSGMGGLSVLRAVRKLLPREDFVYFGDTAYAPYGTKGKEDIIKRSRIVTTHLIAQGAKAIVIACNTASAVAAQTLREENTLPIIAMEPALKPAAQMRHGGNILVMATPVTLSQPKFGKLMEKYGEGVIPLPCPGLMDFVERMELDTPDLHVYLQRLLSPYQGKQLDAVVLGCTHYPFLRRAIAAHLPEGTPLIDGNDGTARQLKKLLADNGLESTQGEGRVRLESSCGDVRIIERMHELLSYDEAEAIADSLMP